MVLVYMVNGGSQPWKGYERPLGCQTAQMMNAPDPEIYLFMNVTKLFGSDSCEAFSLGDDTQIAWGLYIVFWALMYDFPVPGFASIMALVLFGFGMTNLSLGIISEYIWRIFSISRRLPAFIVKEKIPPTIR